MWPVVLIALPFLTWAPARARPPRSPAGWSRSGLTPLAARRVAGWLWLGIVGNAGVLVTYFCSRSIGLPIGPDTKTVEAWGGLDLVCAIEEILLVVIAAAVLARPGLLARPVRLRSQGAVAGQPAGGARRRHRRDHRGHDARVGRLGGPGRHGLRLVRLVLELDGELVGLPAGRHG
jgi:hypothetical protein